MKVSDRVLSINFFALGGPIQQSAKILAMSNRILRRVLTNLEYQRVYTAAKRTTQTSSKLTERIR